MINVVDRVPTYPNRIKVTHADGTSEYVTWERADEPTVPGTPINKALFDSIVEDIGLNKNTTVYVSTAGSDTLGDGTAANPYATINKAINSLPKNLNGFDATINIAAGVYAEDVLIARAFGGNVVLSGNDGANVSIRSLRLIYGSTLRANRIALTITDGFDGDAITIANSTFTCESPLTIIGNIENGIYINSNGCMHVFGDLTFANTTRAAIDATNNSQFFASKILGAVNSGAGIRSVNGSLVAYSAIEMTAPTLFHTASGGRIYSGAQTSIPNY